MKRDLVLNFVVLAFIWGSFPFVPLVVAAPSPAQQCQSKLHKIIGGFIKCISSADADLAKNDNLGRYGRKIAGCDRNFDRSYDKALNRWPGACPSLGDSHEALRERVATSVDDFTGQVAALVSGTAPTPEPGKATLFNNCSLPVKMMSPTNPALDGTILAHAATDILDLKNDFNRGQANTILVAPRTAADQCADIACSNWTDILYSPPPPNAATNTQQRTGSMWQAPNLLFAAYCQPTNAAANQCTTDSNTPCCGLNMNFDKTFGTTWEITPFSTGGNDFIDLSTNFGSGPTSPPALCPSGGGTDCVTASANIFYNVPIEIEMSGGAECSCGTLGSRESISCTEISCLDAFRHPTDDKQCACSSGGDRGYLITYCPAGSPLPALP